LRPLHKTQFLILIPIFKIFPKFFVFLQLHWFKGFNLLISATMITEKVNDTKIFISKLSSFRKVQIPL